MIVQADAVLILTSEKGETLIPDWKILRVGRTGVMDVKDPALNWLLSSGDPSVRYLTLTDLLDEASDSREVRTAEKQIPNGPVVETSYSMGPYRVPGRNRRPGFLETD